MRAPAQLGPSHLRLLSGQVNQLHVGHGDKVAEIGGVVERVPVAYLDGGDANRHGLVAVPLAQRYTPFALRALASCSPRGAQLRTTLR